VAVTALDSGQPGKLATASELLTRSRWLLPRSATLGHLRGQLAEARGEMPLAVMEAWRVRAVRPLDGDRAEAFDRLLHRIEGSLGARSP
jgi:hypothetical protein